MRFQVSDSFRAIHAISLLVIVAPACAAVDAGGERLAALSEENRRLQEQVRAQQKTIDELSSRMADVLRTTGRHEQELRDLRARPADPTGVAPSALARDQQVRVAAEAGLAFFRTGRDGQFPNSEFRVDDPVISIEAPVFKNAYFFTELKLLTRETNEEAFELGEIYVDFEDVLRTAGWPGLLSLRAGRLSIPFGEEYLVRGPIANPLISHSLSDIWGVDEGIEAYGGVGPLRYVVAVQNGNVSRLRDYNSDKSITGRLSWAPARWLNLSASAMRTGSLDATNDNLSEVWFANGFFRALGPTTRTTTFSANLAEIDAVARWSGGSASLALGRVRFDDSDPLVENARRIRYGYIEVVQTIADKLYGAARYSELHAPKGYPLAGWGPLGRYFFAPSLTEELKRLSVGLGYRFGPPLVLKIEYTWESGRMLNGARRDNEDFFGSEIGVRF